MLGTALDVIREYVLLAFSTFAAILWSCHVKKPCPRPSENYSRTLFQTELLHNTTIGKRYLRDVLKHAKNVHIAKRSAGYSTNMYWIFYENCP